MTNIRDVAKIAGYSVSTVSRVINQQNYVSTATRAAIQKVVDELDYAPNDVARDLSRGKTFNVGVVLPHEDHPYFTQLIHGITTAAFAAKYHVVLLSSRYDADLELQYLEGLRRKAYDALIFTSHGLPLSQLAHYRQYGSIVICEHPRDSGIPAAYAHRRTTYRDALIYLKTHGYQRIGLLMSRPIAVSATSQATADAYQMVFGQRPAPEICVTDVITLADGERAAKTYLKRGQHFDAILANSDDIAIGVSRGYQAAGEAVPFLIGQEHQLSGELVHLPTIDHYFKTVGERALQLAISGEKKTIAINSRLITEQ
ncbi:LacI family DNA-binding transcriptional regulator [Lactiplantibacillus songbeiensis]|uniref:LacI family DNA-binding transcriptional regulator n=1 Tax=Lactiplantibacillus songbeiensis TaxID=2559920 RepID=A0ABW4C5W3_9LACO|nr:LacI family DNA-binding transcriptional regulator [Lactiplantibacillus songbeiensis]